MNTTAHTVAGVDVGGTRKGFHAVVLRGNRIVATFATSSAALAVACCRRHGVLAIGIDAPCLWSLTGRARPCERALAGLGMSCFSTPTRAVGVRHPFYRWMVNGAELFRRMRPYYRLYDGRGRKLEPVCFETFPQAIACSLAGRTLLARRKRVERRRLLEQAGITTGELTTIDDVDAALCALAARQLVTGGFNAYGDPVEGFILVPTKS